MRDMTLHQPVLEMDILGGNTENMFGFLGPPDVLEEFGTTFGSNPDDLKRPCRMSGCHVQAHVGSTLCRAHHTMVQQQRQQHAKNQSTNRIASNEANAYNQQADSATLPSGDTNSNAQGEDGAKKYVRCSSIGCPGQAARENLCAFHFHASKVGSVAGSGYENQFGVPFARSEHVLGAYGTNEQSHTQQRSHAGYLQPERVNERGENKHDSQRIASFNYQAAAAEQQRRVLQNTLHGQGYHNAAAARQLWGAQQQRQSQGVNSHSYDTHFPFNLDYHDSTMAAQSMVDQANHAGIRHHLQSTATGVAPGSQLSSQHAAYFSNRCHQPLCERSAVAGGLCSRHSSRMCRHPGCPKPATASADGSSEYVYCPAHISEATCKEAGCSNTRRGVSGYCQAHVGTRKCQHNNCTRPASTVGVTAFCKTHGGGRRCDHPGCLKFPQGPSGLCIQHGGGRRCHKEGCKKAARGTTNHCMRHGGGKRCAHEGCSKAAAAVGVKNLCVKHGGGHRCKEPGCTKSARAGPSGYCAAHGGGRQCKFAGGCAKYDIGWGYCKRHGGGKRCSLSGCNLPAKSSKGMCVAHLNLSGMASRGLKNERSMPPGVATAAKGDQVHRSIAMNGQRQPQHHSVAHGMVGRTVAPRSALAGVSGLEPEVSDSATAAWLRNSANSYTGTYNPVLAQQVSANMHAAAAAQSQSNSGNTAPQNTNKTITSKRKSLQFDESPSTAPVLPPRKKTAA